MTIRFFHTDQQLLQKIVDDNERAYEILFNRYWPKVYRLAFLYVKNEADAADITQDVFRNLWEKRHKLQIDGSFEPYLMKASKNQIINHFKKQQIRSSHESLAAAQRNHQHFQIGDPLWPGRLARIYPIWMAQLPPSCLPIFHLHENEGLSNQQIAHRLGLSIKTVEYHLQKARKFLKKKIQEETPRIHL